MMSPPKKQRFMLQHVWKTGGSEFCFLARANGWSTPPSHNCYLHVDYGWPDADYDLIANERPLMVENGKVATDFANISGIGGDIEVHDVKWITILRHPYSRTLSHYSHMRAANRTRDFTIAEFLTHHSPRPFYHFWNFVPNQQTRWHCGTHECTHPDLKPEHLVQAMKNLEQLHVVLILEDMKDPNSCTRLQMRHVLNLTKVEVLADLRKKNATQQLNEYARYMFRSQLTKWYEEVVPELGPLVIENGKPNWEELPLQVMAVMGLHNDMDLQLYGYARKLCNDRGLAIQKSLQKQQPPILKIKVPLESDFVDSLSTPLIATSLQVTSIAILSLWMIMLPAVRRLRNNHSLRKMIGVSKHQHQ